ncbi:MAG TPA: host attachment protein [Caulobacteraceae bacterium]|jgi:protein required for attachment to host cells
MPNRKQTTWVTTFDGQIARVYAKGEDGNLRHLDSEGMDARPHNEERPDTPEKRVDMGGGDIAFSTEEQFVKMFTQHLEKRARAGAFDRLIVSADPRSLATFRKAVNGELKHRVAAELNKDHVHTPIKALEQAVSEHL